MQATPEGRVIAWILLILMGLVNAAGYAFGLYQTYWWFDRALHGYTILAITLWLALFLCAPVLDRRAGRDVLIVLLVASMGIAIGALWEVAEWGFDRIASGNAIKGKHDTILDIVMDTAGAVLAAFLTLRLTRVPVRAGIDAR
ncbi:hypothetical protein [Roseomonas harenae]|jgi:uncharacterized membrane protein YjdF|uniref:hypothetical protein n=1 Tax=Muricoccus harenae TaxID=2692566 RepID=UPI0013316623|nr:hypothetical protein [Roseomonas harenae]